MDKGGRGVPQPHTGPSDMWILCEVYGTDVSYHNTIIVLLPHTFYNKLTRENVYA